MRVRPHLRFLQLRFLPLFVLSAMLLGQAPMPVSAANGIDHIVISPPKIADKATLAQNQTVTITVTAYASAGSGSPVPDGTAIWLALYKTTRGGSATACGLTLTTVAQSCPATGGTGSVTVTYTAGPAAGDANPMGSDQLQAQDKKTTPSVQASTSYCYNPNNFVIKPAPIALKGTLLAGAAKSGTVGVTKPNPDPTKPPIPVPDASVYLSIAQLVPLDANFNPLPANGEAYARGYTAGVLDASFTKLELATPTTPPKLFKTGPAAQGIQFYYRAPVVLQPGRDDALIAQDQPSNACQQTSHYAFGTAPSGTRVDRIAGPDRYNTGAAIAGTYAAAGATDTVFIATGVNFPDALAGAAAAGKIRAPVLLVQPNAIPTIVSNQLTRIKPNKIVILGSTGAVSAGVEAQLHAYAPSVSRLGGADRYATAKLVAQTYWPSGSANVFIATGLDFPDALAAAAIAGKLGAPILLANTKPTVPNPTRDALNSMAQGRPKGISNIYIAGGTAAVSSGTQSQLSYWSNSVIRYGGVDRFDTAKKIALAFAFKGTPIVFVATGLNFPDALAGAAPAGMLGGKILLVTQTQIPRPTVDAINSLRPASDVVLGGTGVISDGVKNALATLP